MVLHYNSTISELSEMPEIIELPNKAEEINKKKFNNSKVGNKNSNIKYRVLKIMDRFHFIDLLYRSTIYLEINKL